MKFESSTNNPSPERSCCFAGRLAALTILFRLLKKINFVLWTWGNGDSSNLNEWNHTLRLSLTAQEGVALTLPWHPYIPNFGSLGNTTENISRKSRSYRLHRYHFRSERHLCRMNAPLTLFAKNTPLLEVLTATVHHVCAYISTSYTVCLSWGLSKSTAHKDVFH